MNNRSVLFALCLVVFLRFPAFAQQPSSINFLIVKYGDESATPELAGDFLATFGHYLSATVAAFNNKRVQGWIANNPDSAIALAERHQPVLALVPPGFYLQYSNNLWSRAKPILQIPRFNTNIEKYYLVTAKNGPRSLKDLKNQTIATPFAIDIPYLKNVVFPQDFQPGKDFRIKKSDNLADELFVLLEEGKDGANRNENVGVSAVLLDIELKIFFEEDEFVWPDIKVAWVSEPLPRDLAVVSGLQNSIIQQLRRALLKMQSDETGKMLLDLMQSSGFTEIDWDLLNKTTKQYQKRR